MSSEAKDWILTKENMFLTKLFDFGSLKSALVLRLCL